MPPSTRTRRPARVLVALLVVAAIGVGGWWGVRWWADRFQVVLPLADQCVATVGDQSVAITPEQAKYAAVIVGEAQRRQLIPRAASIALATAYQESGIRNLNYGDLDSLGLFQQRPSQDWGTPDQIMDPWYASGKFYEALVKIPNWQTGDINDIAQQVQISGHPQAYRKHVANARVLASALTGETPASFGCRVNTLPPQQPRSAEAFLKKALGDQVTVTPTPNRLTVAATSSTLAWSSAHLMVANAADYGVNSVTVGGASWSNRGLTWQGTASGTTVVIEFA